VGPRLSELTGHPWACFFCGLNGSKAKTSGAKNVTPGICTPQSQAAIFLPIDFSAFLSVAAKGRLGFSVVFFSLREDESQ
jgi:hypothetical protein